MLLGGFAASGAPVSHAPTASFCHAGCGATAEKPPPVVMMAPSMMEAACSASTLEGVNRVIVR